MLQAGSRVLRERVGGRARAGPGADSAGGRSVCGLRVGGKKGGGAGWLAVPGCGCRRRYASCPLGCYMLGGANLPPHTCNMQHTWQYDICDLISPSPQHFPPAKSSPTELCFLLPNLSPSLALAFQALSVLIRPFSPNFIRKLVCVYGKIYRILWR